MKNNILNKPILIIGVGRSGTTLLMSILNAHPDVVFPPEFHFIRRHIIPNKRINFKIAKKTILNDKYIKRLKIKTSNVISKLKQKNQLTWKIVYKTLLKEYLKNKKGIYIGDKDPKNIEYIPTIYNLFPNAKIIHIIRDPRDVYLSRTKAGWSKNKNWFNQIMAYRIQHQLGRKNGKKYFSNNYYEIKYEDLIQHPKKTLEKMCNNFLPISYDPKMLNFSKNAKEIITKQEKSWKKQATGPLLSNNFKKWENNLSKKKIILIETLCKKAFKDNLYEKEFSTLSFFQKLKLSPITILAYIIEYLYKIKLKFKNNRYE